MFGEKSLKLEEDQPLTLLETGAQFEGKLTFDTQVQINGKFEGEIFSEGTLVIGESAEVKAEIEIGTIIIRGKVIGNIKATSRIEIHPPAEVRGNIMSPSLTIEDGSYFEGNCSMGKEPAAEVLKLNAKANEDE